MERSVTKHLKLKLAVASAVMVWGQRIVPETAKHGSIACETGTSETRAHIVNRLDLEPNGIDIRVLDITHNGIAVQMGLYAWSESCNALLKNVKSHAREETMKVFKPPFFMT